MTTNELIDKMEIMELAAIFSIYADTKQIKEQSDLFTENATLISYMGKNKIFLIPSKSVNYFFCFFFFFLTYLQDIQPIY